MTFAVELCPDVLQSALKAQRIIYLDKIKSSESVLAFKAKWQDKELIFDNRKFIQQMSEDEKRSGKLTEVVNASSDAGYTIDTEYKDFKSMRFKLRDLKSQKFVYVDVENAILKDLNDLVFEEKKLGDAVINLHQNIFYEELQKKIVLTGKGNSLEKILEEIYAETNERFLLQLKEAKLTELWGAYSGQISNPKQWFLSGIGHNPIEANMAARGARSHLASGPEGKLLNFSDHLPKLYEDLKVIEDSQKALATSSILLKEGLLTSIGKERGALKYILSDEVIEVLRKNKRGSFVNEAEYQQMIRGRLKELYNGVEIGDSEINLMTKYFENCDAINPPLFIRDRHKIELALAEHGIVSLDFSGMGVENIKAIMSAMSMVDLSSSSKVEAVNVAFAKTWQGVEAVTEKFNDQKKWYSNIINNMEKGDGKNPVHFSGDDGIFLPFKKWTDEKKRELVSIMSKQGSSKFRVVFVESSFSDGGVIPEHLRSQLVVKSENFEKDIRKAVVGMGPDKISKEQAKKIMVSLDYLPSKDGSGTFNLLIGGEADEEMVKKIEKAAEKYLPSGHKKGTVVLIE